MIIHAEASGEREVRESFLDRQDRSGGRSSEDYIIIHILKGGAQGTINHMVPQVFRGTPGTNKLTKNICNIDEDVRGDWIPWHSPFLQGIQ